MLEKGGGSCILDADGKTRKRRRSTLPGSVAQEGCFAECYSDEREFLDYRYRRKRHCSMSTLIEDLIARRPDIPLLTARDGLRGVEIARLAPGRHPDGH
jgi:hypothetical protein